MGLISFGKQQQRDMKGQQGDCGCGCAGKGDCGDKSADSTSMGGPFTEGVGTGAGIALGVVAMAWLVSKLAGAAKE